MIVKNNIRGSEFWVNSELMNFPDIQIQSRVPGKWLHYTDLEPEYSFNLVKPINRYVSNLYPKPEIVSIVGNTVRLIQKTHAEIWVKIDKKGEDLYALDKTWQRQFYPSPDRHSFEDCFLPTYRFYVPWFINKNINVIFKEVDSEESPFRCLQSEIYWIPPHPHTKIVNTNFVSFGIKRQGKHMENEEYGIISIGSPMYEIVVQLEEPDIEKIRREYEK